MLKITQLVTLSSENRPSAASILLLARASRSSEQIIVPVNDAAADKNGIGPAFYCVHSISGTAGIDFIDLGRHLNPAVRMYGIQAPPKKITDCTFGSSIVDIAQLYANTLNEFQPTGPITLGGYCLGAVIALEMAQTLRSQGRDVGPLVVIDGAPENSGVEPHLWTPSYWAGLVRNIPGWLIHSDIMRNKSLRGLFWSISTKAYALAKHVVGLKRGEKLLGGYAIDDFMDLSIYPPAHRLFINRLFAALFAYVPAKYQGPVIVYKAQINPLLYLPATTQVWQALAPQTKAKDILGTHIGMMHEPYVSSLATDMSKQITEYLNHLKATDPIDGLPHGTSSSAY